MTDAKRDLGAVRGNEPDGSEPGAASSAPLDLLDPYRAAAISARNYGNLLLGEPVPAHMMRKILLELGFTHPVEQANA